MLNDRAGSLHGRMPRAISQLNTGYLATPTTALIVAAASGDFQITSGTLARRAASNCFICSFIIFLSALHLSTSANTVNNKTIGGDRFMRLTILPALLRVTHHGFVPVAGRVVACPALKGPKWFAFTNTRRASLAQPVMFPCVDITGRVSARTAHNVTFLVVFHMLPIYSVSSPALILDHAFLFYTMHGIARPITQAAHFTPLCFRHDLV